MITFKVAWGADCNVEFLAMPKSNLRILIRLIVNLFAESEKLFPALPHSLSLFHELCLFFDGVCALFAHLFVFAAHLGDLFVA